MLVDKPSDSMEELLRLTQDAHLPNREDLPGIDPAALAPWRTFWRSGSTFDEFVSR